jgi:polyhydroxyalkanoate synthesis regulator phasin
MSIAALKSFLEDQFDRMVKFGYVKADRVTTQIVEPAHRAGLEATIVLSFDLEREDFDNSEGTKKLQSILRSSIVDSVCHQRQVEEMTKEITDLRTQVVVLEAKVKELEPFKTHYDLSYEMAHGKNK